MEKNTNSHINEDDHQNLKIDESDEIREFIKQKELQNRVLKKIIEKLHDKKIKDK